MEEEPGTWAATKAIIHLDPVDPIVQVNGGSRMTIVGAPEKSAPARIALDRPVNAERNSPR